jgi:hypothetical protein
MIVFGLAALSMYIDFWVKFRQGQSLCMDLSESDLHNSVRVATADDLPRRLQRGKFIAFHLGGYLVDDYIFSCLESPWVFDSCRIVFTP